MGAAKKESREKWNDIFVGRRSHDQDAEFAAIFNASGFLLPQL